MPETDGILVKKRPHNPMAFDSSFSCKLGRAGYFSRPNDKPPEVHVVSYKIMSQWYVRNDSGNFQKVPKERARHKSFLLI